MGNIPPELQRFIPDTLGGWMLVLGVLLMFPKQTRKYAIILLVVSLVLLFLPQAAQFNIPIKIG